MVKKIPVALQLYSVRDDCARDLPGVLKAVAEMGYDGVEFAGYHGFSANDLKKLLAQNKLKVAGTHLGLDALIGDELPKTVEFNKTIGNKYLIVPGLPEERRNSRKAWQITAEIFNGISSKLVKLGMRTGYHNHSIEFTPMDGELPWDTFFGLTDEKVVMQLDTGNAMHGGADPVPFLKRYPGRAATVHLKEFSKTNDKALIGEGDVDWKKIFKLCEGPAKTKWYIVEQESYAYSPLDCVAKCLENIRKMGR